MAIFRIEKNKNFTVMSNYHLQDKKLSLKAKGLLSFMLSLPKGWDYSKSGLVRILKEGEEAISTAIDELKKEKYLAIIKVKNTKGQYEYIYNIYERPYDEKSKGGNPEGGNPGVELPDMENQPQINTNKQNTNNKNNICPSTEEQESLTNNFDKIWKEYPRKDGKNSAFNHYKAWLKGKQYAGKTAKLENKEMWYAVQIYRYELFMEKVEKQYIKMGSTFFNEAIFEYASKYKSDTNNWEIIINQWRKENEKKQ